MNLKPSLFLIVFIAVILSALFGIFIIFSHNHTDQHTCLTSSLSGSACPVINSAFFSIKHHLDFIKSLQLNASSSILIWLLFLSVFIILGFFSALSSLKQFFLSFFSQYLSRIDEIFFRPFYSQIHWQSLTHTIS